MFICCTFAALWQMYTLRIYFHQKWRESFFPLWKVRLKDVSLEWGSYYSSFRFLKPAGGSWHTNMEAELRDKNNCESIVVISAFFFFFFCSLVTWADKFFYLPKLFWVVFLLLASSPDNICKLSPLILNKVLCVSCRYQDQVGRD